MAQSLSVDGQHRGSIQIDDYTIFPENRLGNALYQKGLFLLSEESRSIQAVLKILDGTLYAGRTDQDAPFLAYHSLKEHKLASPFVGYGQLTANNRRYLFWFSKEAQLITSILPQLRSTNGLAYNKIDKLAMYHVSASDNTTSPTTYFFNIHVFRETDSSVSTVRRNVADTRSFLSLNWVNQNQLEYQLKNGTKTRISVK